MSMVYVRRSSVPSPAHPTSVACSESNPSPRRRSFLCEGDKAGWNTQFLKESIAENLNGGLRDEFLNGETFSSMREVKMLVERWRVHYDLDRRSLQPIEIGAPL